MDQDPVSDEEYEQYFFDLAKECAESARLRISVDFFRSKKLEEISIGHPLSPFAVTKKPNGYVLCYTNSQTEADFIENTLNLLLVIRDDLKEHQAVSHELVEILKAPDAGMGLVRKAEQLVERNKELEELLMARPEKVLKDNDELRRKLAKMQEEHDALLKQRDLLLKVTNTSLDQVLAAQATMEDV